jgi:hypothetical protein
MRKRIAGPFGEAWFLEQMGGSGLTRASPSDRARFLSPICSKNQAQRPDCLRIGTALA